MKNFIFLESSNWWADVFAVISPFLTFMIAWIAIWIPFFTAWVARYNKKKLVKNFVEEMKMVLGKIIKENYDSLVSSQHFVSEIISFKGDYLKNLQTKNDLKLNTQIGNVLAAIKIYEEGIHLLETMFTYKSRLKTKNAENYEWLMKQLFADFNGMKNSLSVLDVRLHTISEYKANEDLIKRMNCVVTAITSSEEKEKVNALLKTELIKKVKKHH